MTLETRTGRRDTPTLNLPQGDLDAGRGRKRDRSMTRANVKSVRAEESSTFRGRSPRRATSPFDRASGSGANTPSSSSLLSPTRHLLLHNIRRARREHCPSRVGSASGQAPPHIRRARSRSRGQTSLQAQLQEIEAQRVGDALSGLRNEVRMDEPDVPGPEKS